MIPPRLIPVLLVDRNRRVVKTIRFGQRTYVGDPLNIIRLFNEKEVDEICVLDIDATTEGREPDFAFVQALAAECFMPLSYGGGIASIHHARRLIGLGIEKLVLRSHASDALVASIAGEFGSQAVIGCLDYHEADRRLAFDSARELLEDEAIRLIRAGAGELILQSVDRDGSRAGMDVDTISALAKLVTLPLIALGGAGTASHLEASIAAGADAAASGSAFCFIGRLRAVLVSYPEYADRLKGGL